MHILIDPAGVVRCVYSEAIDLPSLGRPVIRRGSHVEPTAAGEWIADLSPVGGPQLGSFRSRRQALAAEVHWLDTHWLIPGR